MSQNVKILSKLLLNISLNKIDTVNQSELTSQQYHAMELPNYYAFLVDPDSMQSTLEFFGCLGLDSNQGATGIFDAIIVAFQKYGLHPCFKK